ncbi:MAG: hypothetical protein KA715_02130 [Xanthomonadaceae bacterium]|nr:hypothetical protein [Xanthomonadaceae bacterium]
MADVPKPPGEGKPAEKPAEVKPVEAKKPTGPVKVDERFSVKNIDEVIDKLKKEYTLLLASASKKEKIFAEFDIVDAETKRLEESLRAEYEGFIKILKQSRLANDVYHVSLYEEIFDAEKNRLADFKA